MSLKKYLIAMFLLLSLPNGCYTVVQKINLISNEERYPYMNRDFIGKWIYYGEQMPDNYLRRVSKIELIGDQSYYFYPDKNLTSQYSIGNFEVVGDTIIFNIGSKSNSTKYIFSVSSDTLKLRPKNKSDIQFWYKEKPPLPPKITR